MPEGILLSRFPSGTTTFCLYPYQKILLYSFLSQTYMPPLMVLASVTIRLKTDHFPF